MPPPVVYIPPDADLIFFAAFELGAFSSQHDEKLRLARSEQGWLKDLAPVLRRLATSENLAWPHAEIVESMYRHVNERIGASTLAAQEARQQMPLRIPAVRRPWTEAGELFTWRLASVSIGPQGAACIRHQARLVRAASVDSFITEYHILVQDIYRNLVSIARELLEGLSKADGPLDTVEFTLPVTMSLGAYLASYESLDIEFEVVDESDELSTWTVKRLVEQSLPCARQLAALSRMTKTEPDHLDERRLQAFKNADIGNREDEIWIVNSNRMLRSHPNRQDQSVVYFHDDVLTFIEIVLQQLAAMEYVESWLHHAYARFRKELVNSQSAATSNVGNILVDIEQVLDLLVQPGNLIIGIRHAFFRKLAEQLVDELRLSTVCDQTQHSISIFTEAVSAAFAYRASVSSQAATRTIRALTWAIMVGTIIAISIAIIALVLGAGG
jgi:hypothetical protein